MAPKIGNFHTLSALLASACFAFGCGPRPSAEAAAPGTAPRVPHHESPAPPSKVLAQVGAPAVDESTPASPELQRAVGLLRSGRASEAASLFEALLEEHPNAARAWLLLGRARRASGALAQALVALERAATFSSTAAEAKLDSGLVHAELGELDEAFSAFEAARASGKVDVTRVGVSPVAAKLAADARYARLFPTADEFARPFVEPVTILHEWVGEAVGDQFGWIARNIGDVDGDGTNDVVTSAPTHDAPTLDRGSKTKGRPTNEAPAKDGGEVGTKDAGRIYVYSGRSGGLLWRQDGPAGAQLGMGVEAAGDVDRDGIPDVVASAPAVGKAWIYSGRSGTLLRELDGTDGEKFGGHVADAGDVNGDGYADVLVGAPDNDDRGTDAGAAYLYSGRSGKRLYSFYGEQPGDHFGAAVAGSTRAKDRLLVVGAPDAGPDDRGRTYVYKDLAVRPAFVLDAVASGQELGGMFVSVVGDVDRDGVDDIYASDWYDDAMKGRVYLASGRDGRVIRMHAGEAAGDGFGIGVADAGDVDGDGHADAVIGAWSHAGAAPAGGKVYVYSGRDGKLLRAITGRVMGETFGFDATGMGDVDRDGAIDFLLTSAWSAKNGARSGRVYVISGRGGAVQ